MMIDCFLVFNATFSNISAISWRKFREKKKDAMQPQQQTKFFVPTQSSILFHWQSKVIDHVNPSIPLFLLPFLYFIELVLVLNIAEILSPWTLSNNQLINRKLEKNNDLTNNLLA